MTDFLHLAQSIAAQVKAVLVSQLGSTGFVGDSLSNPEDLKSTHRIDLLASRAAVEVLAAEPCHIVMESFPTAANPGARYTVFIDPVDGSLNWDRGVGDPCVVIAVAERVGHVTFGDLNFAYVEGLRSGDQYYTRSGRSYFKSALLGREHPISVRRTTQISSATAYLRPGYSLARRQIERTLPVFLAAKDIRSIENTGIEIAEIARGAADILIEARGASDAFNLLAYPILRQAGGVITDIDGESIDATEIKSHGHYDFIAAVSAELVKNARGCMAGAADSPFFAAIGGERESRRWA